MIDTHAHFGDKKFDVDRHASLQRAKETGVSVIIEIAEKPEEWNQAKNLAKEYSDPKSGLEIFWTCGFHPYYADRWNPSYVHLIEECIKDKRCVAIGEIGLDYHRNTVKKEVQMDALRELLLLACEHNRPVSIHSRDAQKDTVQILNSIYAGLSNSNMINGVIHCFAGDAKFAEKVIELGFFLGVDAPITYPSSHQLREVLKSVPCDKVVLETDCPYLPPQQFRGKRNESSYLHYIVTELSKIWSLSEDEIRKKTTENAKKLYRLQHNKT